MNIRTAPFARKAAAVQAARFAERPALWSNVRRNALAEADRAHRWRPARDALWTHVDPFLAAGARVAVVGAGNTDDLPLTRLARRAGLLVLFDLDAYATRAARRREPLRLRRRIETVQLDITDGAADAVAAAAVRGQPPPMPPRPRALPGAPYDLVIGDLFYSQLLFPALHDLGVAESRREAVLARDGAALTEYAVTRLHASAPTGHVTHVHDVLGWWPGHDQPADQLALVELAARHPAATLASARRGRGPHYSDPVAAMRRLGATPLRTSAWMWPFATDTTYLVCAATISSGPPRRALAGRHDASSRDSDTKTTRRAYARS